MKYIIGLGNPDQYIQTNHNLGKDLLKEYLLDKGIKVEIYKDITLGRKDGISYIYTNGFMNDTGTSLNSILKDVDAEKVLIIHDEILLPRDELKLTKGFKDSKHNGVISVKEIIGEKFYRLRIGIDRGDPLKVYVLEKIGDEEFQETKTKFLNFFEGTLEKFKLGGD